MSKLDELLHALKRARVLRSSCEHSMDGNFRVHLVETEWDEIRRLALEAEVEENEWIYCEEHGHEQKEPCPDCAARSVQNSTHTG